MTHFRGATLNDLAAIEALLRASRLPTDGVAEALDGFVVAEQYDQLLGCGGVERLGTEGLLRSLAVAPAARGTGLGHRLVARLLSDAAQQGLERLWLLTETAEGFFPRFGFRRVPRERASEALRATDEFTRCCPASAAVMVRRVAPLRVLVLCTANSARSQIAEALLQHRGGGLFSAGSAGTAPGKGPHPEAVAELARRGIDWQGRRSRSIEEAGEDWDLVVTVCDGARESCPVMPGRAMVHWGLDDPAAVADAAARQAAFAAVADALERRVEALSALPIGVMTSAEIAAAMTGDASPATRHGIDFTR